MIGFFVAFTGLLVGISELLTRYTDNPSACFKSGYAYVYLLINAGVALLALYVIQSFNFFECATEPCTGAETLQLILISGLGGMAVLRASITTIRVQGQDVGVGPAAILQIYLNVADRAIDRKRAEARADHVAKLVKNIDFNKAKIALPAACFALMQNVSVEEQQVLGDQVRQLDSTGEISDMVKTTVLALALLDVVGEGALKSAITLLGNEITLEE